MSYHWARPPIVPASFVADGEMAENVRWAPLARLRIRAVDVSVLNTHSRQTSWLGGLTTAPSLLTIALLDCLLNVPRLIRL